MLVKVLCVVNCIFLQSMSREGNEAKITLTGKKNFTGYLFENVVMLYFNMIAPTFLLVSPKKLARKFICLDCKLDAHQENILALCNYFRLEKITK